uniref:Annexin D2 n=1 Tax=Papaver somniferum TaxID=3469 RepID=A0A5B7LJV9_PAPSO|nr:annexin D2 [Papaver somniferum]
MASLIVPDSIPSVAQDIEQLHKAFSDDHTPVFLDQIV